MKSKRLILILATVGLLLLLPFFNMKLGGEVNWTAIDFLVMGILLLFTGLTCELIVRKVTQLKYRIALIVIILGIFLLLWIELAVGIFGTPFAGS